MLNSLSVLVSTDFSRKKKNNNNTLRITRAGRVAHTHGYKRKLSLALEISYAARRGYPHHPLFSDPQRKENQTSRTLVGGRYLCFHALWAPVVTGRIFWRLSALIRSLLYAFARRRLLSAIAIFANAITRGFVVALSLSLGACCSGCSAMPEYSLYSRPRRPTVFAIPGHRCRKWLWGRSAKIHANNFARPNSTLRTIVVRGENTRSPGQDLP